MKQTCLVDTRRMHAAVTCSVWNTFPSHCVDGLGGYCTSSVYSERQIKMETGWQLISAGLVSAGLRGLSNCEVTSPSLTPVFSTPAAQGKHIWDF